MTEEQIQERLLQAALTEDIVIPEGLEERLEASLQFSPREEGRAMRIREKRAGAMRRRQLRWVGYAAAVVAAAITIPIVVENRQPPAFTDTCRNAEEARAELQSALATLQPSHASSDLLNLLQ